MQGFDFVDGWFVCIQFHLPGMGVGCRGEPWALGRVITYLRGTGSG